MHSTKICVYFCSMSITPFAETATHLPWFLDALSSDITFNEKKSSSINLPSAPTWPCKAWTVHSFIQASLEELRVLVSQFVGRTIYLRNLLKVEERDNFLGTMVMKRSKITSRIRRVPCFFFFGPKRHSKSRAISTDNIPMITGQFPKVTPQLIGPNIVGLGFWWASQGHPITVVSIGYIIVHKHVYIYTHTPPKTEMTMEKQPVEVEDLLLKHGDFPLSC